MILLLVGLKLTSNDLNSRMTKASSRHDLSQPRFRTTTTTTDTHTADFSTPTGVDIDLVASRFGAGFGGSDYDLKEIKHNPEGDGPDTPSVHAV